MKKERLSFKQMSLEEILNVILQNNTKSDAAMVYMLNVAVKRHLKTIYEQKKQWLDYDFEETISDFFIYLREGKRKKNIVRYEALQTIRDHSRFATWIGRSYTFFLINLSLRIRKYVSLETLLPIADKINMEEFLSKERMINIASKVIAYVHQISSLDQRIILFSWLMGKYDKSCPHTRQELAEILGLSNVAFRVRTFTVKKKIHAVRTELMKTGKLPMDGEHLRMAESINESISNLSPLLTKYYGTSFFIRTGIIL